MGNKEMIENEIIKKKFKSKLIGIVVGMLMIAAAVTVFHVKDYASKKAEEASIHLADAYNNETLDTVDMVYVNLTDYLYEFCYYNEAERYYFGFDEYDDIYIIRCSQSEEEAIAKEIDEKGIARVVGRVSKLNTEVQELALEYLNADEGEITQESFETYFQGVALWVNPITDFDTLTDIGAALSGILGFLVVVFCAVNALSFMKGSKGLNEMGKYRIASELSNIETEYIKKCDIFLTPTYLVYVGMRFEIIPYEEMIWVYTNSSNVNTIPGCNISIWLKNGKEKCVGEMLFNVAEQEDIIKHVFEVINRHNPRVYFGNNKDFGKQLGKKKRF